MKVILTAFDGRLQSKILEFPELAPSQAIYFPLRQVRHDYDLVRKPPHESSEPVDIRARFEPTGRGQVLKSGAYAREYELVDVDPRYWE